MKYCTDEKCFSFTEESFNPMYTGKCESIMCQGNGYLGVRAALEEAYTQSVRSMFVAGTFNSFEGEVTELPNTADLTALQIYINGLALDMTKGVLENYSRTLNMENGLLTRSFTYTAPNGDKCKLCFERIVSMRNKHIIAQKISITPLSADLEISYLSGIDGRTTNSGSQHFIEGEHRYYEKLFLQSNYKTIQSGIDFVLNTAHRFTCENKSVDASPFFVLERRKIFVKGSFIAKKGSTVEIEKISSVHTSRDNDAQNAIQPLNLRALAQLRTAYKDGFSALLLKSAECWQTEVWSKKDIVIDTENKFEQLAVRFAVYHLTVMSPVHDNRMNIGAKGLSGEGYKGHTFWDTEVFMLPYFIFTDPAAARSLMEYRYNCLDGARRKAAENGYKGAMYPWESAWITDGEVTPLYGAADVVTGTAIPILTGMIEQHITADVAYGAHYYYTATGDKAFMEKCGYEIIIDTAVFWLSRLEENKATGRLEITDVIGPDEYKEHVSNNAYTNYMSHWNITQAIANIKLIKAENAALYEVLNKKFGFDTLLTQLNNAAQRIYLPKVNADGIIPQDDTFLSLKEIDLEKYKKAEIVGTIYNDYNMEQINELKVSKQADVLVLLYLFGSLVSDEIKAKNFYFYEKHCLHDSSLSLSTHSVLASDLGEEQLAHRLFNRACEIDLGPNMKTSDAGVHAASFGGVWQCVVNGFFGVRIIDGELYIAPKIPKSWNSVSCKIYFKGTQLQLTANKDGLTVNKLSGEDVCAYINKEKTQIGQAAVFSAL